MFSSNQLDFGSSQIELPSLYETTQMGNSSEKLSLRLGALKPWGEAYRFDFGVSAEKSARTPRARQRRAGWERHKRARRPCAARSGAFFPNLTIHLFPRPSAAAPRAPIPYLAASPAPSSSISSSSSSAGTWWLLFPDLAAASFLPHPRPRAPPHLSFPNMLSILGLYKCLTCYENWFLGALVPVRTTFVHNA